MHFFPFSSNDSEKLADLPKDEVEYAAAGRKIVKKRAFNFDKSCP